VVRRWWTDPDDALQVLACVDGSDPAAGVSTAFLGFHALQRSALEPLRSSTLVDGAVVDAHLREVDVEPVAKAVATATRPVMGDAADAYGDLVARDMRERSREAAQDVLLRWTRQGMPWPTAVQRLSTIVGVPTRELGKTVDVLSKPVTDLVAGDYGDRVLMGHAQRVGQTQPDPVSKALGPSELVMFNRERPRDDRGRFADKPGAPGGTREARLARRARRDRKSRRRERRTQAWAREAEQRQQVIEQAQSTQGRSFLAGFFHRMESSTSRPREVARQDPRQDPRKDPRLKARTLRPVATSTQDQLLPKVKATEAIRLDGRAYAIVDRSVMDAMLVDMQAEKFNIKGLSTLLGSSGITAYDSSTMDEILRGGHIPNDIADPLVVEFNTLAVTDADGLTTFELAEDAEYELYDTVTRPSPGRRAQYDVVNSMWQTPARQSSPGARKAPMKLVEQVSFVLSNEDAFQRQGQDLPFDQGSSRVWRVNRMGDLEIGKNLSGPNLAEFNREHPRDEEGRFTDKTPQDPAADRRARRARRRRRTERRWRELEQAQVNRETQGRTQASEPSPLQTLFEQRGLQERRADRPDPRKDPRLVRADRLRQDYSTRLRQEHVQRMSRVYGQRRDESRQSYDYAAATALLLDDAEFTDLTGLGPDDRPLSFDFMGEWDSPLEYLVDTSRMSGTEALHRVVSGSITSRQRSTTRPLPAQDSYVGYDTEEEAAQAALEYINEYQMDTGTTMSWDAAVAQESHRDSGKAMWFPKRVGYELDEAKVMIFGSSGSIDTMGEFVDVSRLERIPADTLSDLLALRSNDAALTSLDVSDTIPNPAVRAYWYRDEG
jgi:hypothetical protein